MTAAVSDAAWSLPDAATLAELVRLPAVLSIPGDAWLGAAAAGVGGVRSIAMPIASGLIYLGGMALNDWADRGIDAIERPERPIPSGRVAPVVALGIGGGMVVTGIVVAGVLGGDAATRIAVPLAGAVWIYDVIAKDTDAGPFAMAACRSLDVLLGAAGGGVLRALPSSMAVGGHTVVVTQVSRHEVHGAPASVPRMAAAASFALGALTVATSLRGATSRFGRLLALAGGGVYLSGVGGAYLKAAGEADASGQVEGTAIRPAVGAAVMGVMPLQAALLAGRGATLRATAVAGLVAAGRALKARRSAT